jgi:hypothetical protein
VADTGKDPDPLQRLSTRKVYVVTRRPDAQLDPTRLAIAVPLSASSRIFVGNVVVTNVNEIAAERISSRPRRSAKSSRQA